MNIHARKLSLVFVMHDNYVLCMYEYTRTLISFAIYLI